MIELWSKELLQAGKKRLLYACYKYSSDPYVYVKYPLGSDKTVYWSKNFGLPAQSPDELVPNLDYVSVTEDKIRFIWPGLGELTGTRYREGDLYG